MKKGIVSLVILLLTSTLIFAQPRWRQKNARVNFAITPQAEFMKVAGIYSPVASLNASIVFNDTWYAGIYVSKKPIPLPTEYDLAPGVKLDPNFQHIGGELMYALKLGLKRTKGGHYVPRRMRVTFGLRIGGGSIWLDDENGEKVSPQDYFYYAQPAVGALWPINDFLKVNAGVFFGASYSVDKLNPLVEDSDFITPGGFVSLKISLFR
jgi:hypothetical protein